MQVKNSFCIPVFNRYTLVGDGVILHPMDKLVEGILAQKPQESFEIVVVDFNSTDTDYAWLRRLCSRTVLFTIHEKFSLGRGRNLAAHIATGERLFILDTDMIIPDDFVHRLAGPVDAGRVCFPKYFLTHKNGKIANEGQGWGNVAMLKKVYLSLCAKGICWPDKTEYGGEDVAFSSQVVKGKKAVPFERAHIPNFLHSWHPRIGEWYHPAKQDVPHGK